MARERRYAVARGSLQVDWMPENGPYGVDLAFKTVKNKPRRVADIRRKVGAGVQEVQRAFDRYYCVHGNPPDSIRVHKTTMDNLRLEAKRVGQNADGTLTLYGMKVTL